MAGDTMPVAATSETASGSLSVSDIRTFMPV